VIGVAKEHEYRFSITLNRNDPLHRTAINALNAQGRRKSQFIVNAITNYIMEGKSTETLIKPDRAYIEEICREVYQSYRVNEPLGTEKALPELYEDQSVDNYNESEEDLGFIADSLNSFRKKP